MAVLPTLCARLAVSMAVTEVSGRAQLDDLLVGRCRQARRLALLQPHLQVRLLSSCMGCIISPPPYPSTELPSRLFGLRVAKPGGNPERQPFEV